MGPKLDLMLLVGLDVFCALVAFFFFLQRYRWRRRRRKGSGHWGFYPSGAGLGNALQELSVLAHPRVEYVIEEKAKDDAVEDDEGGPDDPTAHLHRQAAQLRKGEKTDRFTAKVR